MFKSIAAASLLCSLALSAIAAELPQKETRRFGVAVSEFLERSSKMPQGPEETVLIKAIAELKAKEGIAGEKQEQAQGASERCIFRLRNVPVADVAEALQKRVDERQAGRTASGRTSLPVFVCEPVSNCLLVSAAPAMMENLRPWIAVCDMDPDMVSVYVLIARVLPGDGEKAESTLPAIPREGADATEWLAAAKAQKRLDVLSRPMIMTDDHREARIQIGEWKGIQPRPEPYIGLQVVVVPHVTDDGSIRLDVDIEKSSLAEPGGEDAKPVQEIKAKTTVAARSDETRVVVAKEQDGSPIIVALTPRIVSEIR